MRGSQLYTALFFPSLKFFPTGFSLASYLDTWALDNRQCCPSIGSELPKLTPDHKKGSEQENILQTPTRHLLPPP
ncbi:hypothetical protein LXL04_026352 [Taraxacum kok-saghyz]